MSVVQVGEKQSVSKKDLIRAALYVFFTLVGAVAGLLTGGPSPWITKILGGALGGLWAIWVTWNLWEDFHRKT